VFTILVFRLKQVGSISARELRFEWLQKNRDFFGKFLIVDYSNAYEQPCRKTYKSRYYDCATFDFWVLMDLAEHFNLTIFDTTHSEAGAVYSGNWNLIGGTSLESRSKLNRHIH
jgi:hypothetical protein